MPLAYRCCDLAESPNKRGGPGSAPLSAYALAMRCPVLTYCTALPGRKRLVNAWLRMMLAARKQQEREEKEVDSAMLLRVRYAMSGTDLGVWCYQREESRRRVAGVWSRLKGGEQLMAFFKLKGGEKSKVSGTEIAYGGVRRVVLREGKLICDVWY
eukprot:545061-Rhodomonas_salina.1